MTISPSNANAESENLHGIGLKDPTVVYSQASTSSTHLKSYAEGSVLIYRTYNTDWYEATVIINGQAKTGYINKNDVETIIDNPQTLHGIGLDNPTPIYSKASTKSKELKSYAQGSVLLYQSFTSGWYKCWVYVNGKLTTGYINKNDVENIASQQQNLHGIGLDNPTKVYSKASTTSGTLKSYDQGTILYYQTFTSHWYECIVYINGQRRTGYIYKSDVEGITNNQQLVHGVGMMSPTKVYSKASTNSSPLKSYSVGSNLIYQTFTSDWFEATVYIHGKPTTGYIYKNDVDGRADVDKTLHGIGLNSPTKVYSYGSTGAPVLKSYAQGSVLRYETLSDHWYQAIVYVNGKRRIGYINKNHVEQIVDNQQTISGIGLGNPTNAYSRASTSSDVLKSYKKGSGLILKTFTSDWYEATVYVNGNPQTSYFKKGDIGDKVVNKTNYNISLSDAVDKQMNADPLTDTDGHYAYVYGDYIANGKVNIDSGYLNVRDEPSTDSRVVGKLQNGNNVTVVSKEGSWTKIYFTWKYALKEDVQYYLDPNNFKEGSEEYYQFLDLSSLAGLTVDEVNNKILDNAGILTGKADIFLKAAKANKVNEIYLLSHALLETGNGTSNLATGKDVVNGKQVFNMFGIGAKDSCPETCGAQYAYDHQWFTPEAAIEGGAEFLAEDYIHDGQNTLYKMRWNPAAPATHQYASDIGWAVKQTNIFDFNKYYGLLDNYSLFFDVPVYK